jgi:hypothetical protein
MCGLQSLKGPITLNDTPFLSHWYNHFDTVKRASVFHEEKLFDSG